MDTAISGKESIMTINTIRKLARRLWADENGLAAVEYGLLAAGIAIALWTVIGGVGDSLSTIFTSVQTDLTTSPS
jgi:pilus assembly protein Flp/PilA